MSISDYLEAAILNEVLRNTNLAAVATVYLSLHTADPADTGGSEVVGGSYARQAVAFDAPAAGVCVNSAAEEFASMPAVTVTHIGLWDDVAAGNLLWSGPIGGASFRAFSATNVGDLFTSAAHGYVDTDRVIVTAEPTAGLSLPTGVVEGTLYYVVTATADTFQLSATSGGAAITLTSDGNGLCVKVSPGQVLVGQTFRIAAGALSVKLA